MQSFNDLAPAKIIYCRRDINLQGASLFAKQVIVIIIHMYLHRENNHKNIDLISIMAGQSFLKALV